MTQVGPKETLDVAMLPLADGRQVIMPLGLLAEVQQISLEDRSGSDLGELEWRGHDLPVESFDVFCGLPEPELEKLTTVGIFKAHKDSASPFRALAFAGTASHGRIEPGLLNSREKPTEGAFIGATVLHEQSYFIADIPGLLYKP